MRGQAFRRYFQLPSQLVAVKFLYEDVEGSSGNFRFCEAVKRASKGERIVLTEFNLSCSGAEISLGFIPPLFDEENEVEYENETEGMLNGERKSDERRETKAVIVEPYRGQECDVILVIATPDKIMRISSLYSQLFNESIHAVFKGENAVCGEATAYVKESGKPNVSFLCEGAREYANYSREEIVIGFPEEIFKKMDLAIEREQIKSLCGCLMDDLPLDVVNSFEKLGFDKATDHFIGFYNGRVVKIYIFKGDRNAIGIYSSVKFKNEEDAENVVNKYDGNLIVSKRENWVEVSHIEDMDVFREVKSPGFEERIKKLIEIVVEEAKKIKET